MQEELQKFQIKFQEKIDPQIEQLLLGCMVARKNEAENKEKISQDKFIKTVQAIISFYRNQEFKLTQKNAEILAEMFQYKYERAIKYISMQPGAFYSFLINIQDQQSSKN